MRLYPIGEQDFKGIREENKVYVDKTELICTLIKSGKYYFLSRPRRFGKSLLLSTVKEIFKGSKDLFKGLWIEDNWNWEKKHPVIHLKLSSINYQALGLQAALSKEVDVLARELGVLLLESNLKDKFRELIEKAAVHEKVVILIDEYDKAIIDYLDDIPTAEENRSVFKEFYSVLKDADEYIRLLLITGVSRFAKVSIFSDLNNLNDITLSTRFGALLGITQEEVEKNFVEEIILLQQKDPDILNKIKSWYNGYSWDASTRVYNPFSLLNFMSEPVFRNYWFATGSPSFLIKQIRKTGEYKFENVRLGENALGNFDILNSLSVPLLFQTGYLTIKDYDPVTRTYVLDYPNLEVKSSLLDNLLSAYREVFPGDSTAVTGDLFIALQHKDIPKVIAALNNPYKLFTALSIGPPPKNSIGY